MKESRFSQVLIQAQWFVLFAVLLVGVCGGWAQSKTHDWRQLQIGDAQNWSFLHGSWQETAGGEMVLPDGTDVEYLAVKQDEVYSDFTAEVRFKFRGKGGGARLLFRLQDSRRFYALEVPWCAQQNRARHFWAGILVADGTPLQRYLSFRLIPGLCAEVGRWYEAKLEARGSRLRAWIEGRLVADVEDTTYSSGRLGLGGLATPYRETPRFAELKVKGSAVRSSDSRGLKSPPPHWITPCKETDPNTYQSYASLLKSGTGEIVLCLTYGNPNRGETRRAVFLRSKDAGRSWGEPEPATLQKGLGANFIRRDGTWVCIFHKPNVDPKDTLYTYESKDEGRTWAGPHTLGVEREWGPGVIEWPEGWLPGGPIRPVRLRDGSLVLPVITGEDKPGSAYLKIYTAFALRSEDDGRTWSNPVRCDRQNLDPGKPLELGSAAHDLSALFYELGIAEAEDNVLLGLGRPGRDPYMWQIQSNDGGRTWEPAAIGPCPGYCPSLTRTTSGALVATTRFPYFAAHLSRDGGRTWDPPVIVDYPMWANQQAVEAEPDVVLVTYMGHIQERGQADSRIARLRVTDEGLRLDH